jgi:hypothetical protein
MITLGLVFRPLPTSSAENTLISTGTIEQVVETGNSVVFKLKDDDRFYYVDEELGKGLSSSELRQELSGKSVQIHYVKHWTPIDPLRVMHVTKVDLNKMTLYSSN